MPRPKGSKNKPKTIKTTVDFAAQLAEKQSAKEAVAAEIATTKDACKNADSSSIFHFCKRLYFYKSIVL